MIINLEHNYVRTCTIDNLNIVEIGAGKDITPSLDKDTVRASVHKEAEKGIAIGHDAYVNKSYGIVIGNHGKVDSIHGIVEGSYYSVTERYGEKRRTFGTDENKYARGWAEWYGEIDGNSSQSWRSLYLHGRTMEKFKLKSNSCVIFNIKLIGTDERESQSVMAAHISGAIKQDDAPASTALVGTPTIERWYDTMIDVQVIADIIIGALDLRVREHNTNRYTWIAAGWYVELIH